MAALQVEKEGENIAIFETVSTGKIHPYILNNVKAKKELVTNAKLSPINKPTIKPNTTKVQLSTGAYKEVVFPLLDSWSQALRGEAPELSDLEEIKVNLIKIRDDTDQTNKKMDALVHLKFNQDNIQIFFYHTNQSLMVQGTSHQPFYNTFLLPAITKIVNNATQEINEFNSLVIRTLSNQGLDDSVWRSATPDRQHNLRLTRNKATKCDVCGKNCASKSQLKVHMDINHNGGLALAAKPRAGVTATRTASNHQRQLTMFLGQNILSSVTPPPTTQLTLPPPSPQQSTPSGLMNPRTPSTSLLPSQEDLSNPLKSPSKEAPPLEGLQVLLETVRDSLSLLIPSYPLPLGSQALDLAPTLVAPLQRKPQVPLKEACPPVKVAGSPYGANPELIEAGPHYFDEAGPLSEVTPDPHSIPTPPAGLLTMARQAPDYHHDLGLSRSEDADELHEGLKLPCDNCEFNANDTNELMKHKIQIHAARVKLKCYFCPYYSNTKEALTEHLEQHKQDGHLSASGRLLIPDYGFNLDVYDDVLEDNNSFFDDDVAVDQTNDPTPTIPSTPARNKFTEYEESFDALENETCTVCNLKFRNVTVLQEHLLARHCVQSRDVAELLRMQQQLLNKIITLQTKQQQDINKIAQNITEFKNQPPPVHFCPPSTALPHQGPLIFPSLGSPTFSATPLPSVLLSADALPFAPLQDTPSSPDPQPSLPPHPQPQVRQQPRPRLQAWSQPAAPTRFEAPVDAPSSRQTQSPFLPAGWKPKIAYIADSIGSHAHFDLLEKASGAEIKKTKAYCSKFGGRMPSKNFTDIVPKVMGSEKFDYLVIQASSTDLTNLLELPKNTVDEYYRQQASLSSYQMVASVDSALTSHPHLKGVVLMERAPRYDDFHELNRYANTVLHEAVAQSKYTNKIFIGQHTLECQDGLRASRFGSPSSHQYYDGIHLRGTSGKMAYTRSVASIFQQAGILTSPIQVIVPRLIPHSNTQTQEKFQLAAGRRRGFNNPARRQVSFQSAGRSQGVFQQAQQQQQDRPLIPLMEVTIPTQNRFQGFW